jgi:hypothetical protein
MFPSDKYREGVSFLFLASLLVAICLFLWMALNSTTSLSIKLLFLPVFLVALAASIISNWMVSRDYKACQARAENERLEREKELQRELIERIRYATEQLALNPNNPMSQSTLSLIAAEHQRYRAVIYDAALAAVSDASGSVSSKRFALEIGRLHYGGGRDGGLPTTYDEAAIRNDISARTGEM